MTTKSTDFLKYWRQITQFFLKYLSLLQQHDFHKTSFTQEKLENIDTCGVDDLSKEGLIQNFVTFHCDSLHRLTERFQLLITSLLEGIDISNKCEVSLKVEKVKF